MKYQQIPLPIQLPDDETFASFYPGSNKLVITTLQQQFKQNDDFRSIVLQGKERCGKSHLLHSICQYTEQLQLTSFLIALTGLKNYGPDILQGLEQFDVVCIDDLDEVIGDKTWEHELFHLFNRMHQMKKCLVITVRQHINTLAVTLPDLKSRLQWGLSFELPTLDDIGLCEALILRATLRGMSLQLEVAQFLIKRVHRNIGTLMKLLDQLDQASIIQQRRITIPFIKQELGL